MNNKKLGTNFEREACKILADNGYWVHFFTPDSRGAQPFDIIAIKDGRAMAIECKTLASNKKYFTIDRLETNQIMAFEKWLDCGNAMPQVWVLHRGVIHMIPYYQLKDAKKIDLEARCK